jgi:lysine N6-hydroxylase
MNHLAGRDAPVLESEHDLIAIGCGPFNLGLAALASTLPGLKLAVFEKQPELRWHPGLLFEDAQLQLSFLADLVTLVEPTHPLSFLAYLRDMDRMYAFFIRERFHPTRAEYEHYLRWAASKLSSLHFSRRVESARWDARRQQFVIEAAGTDGARQRAYARDLVLGIGSEPYLPDGLRGLPSESCLHSADYLHRHQSLESAAHVTVVGSGQSAAECVLDLLRRNLNGGPAISWLTRARSFAPLDYTKLVLEMTTPEYVRYFHGLPPEVRERLVREQWQHYKGISAETLEQIHDLLYRRELRSELAPVELRCGVSVESAALDARGALLLDCTHHDTGTRFERGTALVVAATGYRARRADFLGPIEPLVRRDALGRYRVCLDYSVELDPTVTGRIFVANAELHTHGVATPDLGIGAYRSATILTTVCGREVYRLPRRTAFTSFAPPAPAAPRWTGSMPAGARPAPATWGDALQREAT